MPPEGEPGRYNYTLVITSRVRNLLSPLVPSRREGSWAQANRKQIHDWCFSVTEVEPGPIAAKCLSSGPLGCCGHPVRFRSRRTGILIGTSLSELSKRLTHCSYCFLRFFLAAGLVALCVPVPSVLIRAMASRALNG